MDNDRIEGIGHQVKGTLRRAFGRVLGDAKIAADGAAEKAIGDARSAEAQTNGQVMGIDIDRIKGVARQLEGALKEGIGGVIGNQGLRQAGIAEREAGKAQNAIGSARDTVREAADKTQ